MDKPKQLFLDKEYIPDLLNNVENDELKKRLEHVLLTYSKRALFYKRMYYILTFATIICPAMVTVVNVFSSISFSYPQLFVTIISALSTIAAGVLGSANIRENWFSYRNNCEILKEEVFKYVMSNEPYNVDDNQQRQDLFIKNMFELYHKESNSWIGINSSKK